MFSSAKGTSLCFLKINGLSSCGYPIFRSTCYLDSKLCCYHDAPMRTTVTLDSDVEQLLRDAMQRRRLSFKEALNQAIRAGLSRSANPQTEETPFVVRARQMGLRAGLDAGRLNQIADELEAEGFDELSRTLSNTLSEPVSKRK